MSALLALLGAAAYGLSDFIGGLLSRRVNPWTVAFGATLSGTVFVLIAGLVMSGEPTSGDMLYGALAGLGNGVGTVFLYRGLASGRMGVVAPISGVGAAVVPVVVAFALGERPAALVWLGIALALPAIWLVSREPEAMPDPDGAEHPPSSSGVLDGIMAGLGFGSLFALLGQIPDEAGLLPLLGNQLVAAVVIAGIATFMGAQWLPRTRASAVSIIPGFLGVAATVAFMTATQMGSLTVAAILASLYPAGTILLAATILREPIHRGQAVGLALCGVAITMVTLGG